MNTLLLRIAGPMQSWGTQSRFRVRDTGMEPSKSGVIGILCAAMGRGRSESVDDLACLRMGVRVDRPGVVRTDYQTAGGGEFPGVRKYGVRRASGTDVDVALSNRYYLVDADFLVGLESGDIGQLEVLDSALRQPVWQVYLGRKSFVPGVPVHMPGGLREGESLESALTKYPWPRLDLDVPPVRLHPGELRLAVEHVDGVDVRMDQPLGNAFETRTFLPRHVTTLFRRLGTGEDEVTVREDPEGACTDVSVATGN